jgi:hypothetical protein
MVRPGGIFAGIIGPVPVVTVRFVSSVASPARGADAHVSWEDLDRFSEAGLNLNRFVERAAVAGLSTRADQGSMNLTDGDLTLGSGTRTVGDQATDLTIAIDLRFRTSAASALRPAVPSVTTSTARS